MEFYPITDLEILLGEKEGVNITVKKEAIKIDIKKMEKGRDYEVLEEGKIYSIYKKGFFIPVSVYEQLNV